MSALTADQIDPAAVTPEMAVAAFRISGLALEPTAYYVGNYYAGTAVVPCGCLEGAVAVAKGGRPVLSFREYAEMFGVDEEYAYGLSIGFSTPPGIRDAERSARPDYRGDGYRDGVAARDAVDAAVARGEIAPSPWKGPL